MNELRIWFKEGAADGEVLDMDVVDVVVNQGFLVAFMPENENGDHTTNAYNIGCIDSWQFIQHPKEGENEDEGVSEE